VTSTPHIKRLGFVLLVRGTLLIPLAALAVRWPDSFLLLGLVAAGAMAGSLGIFEIAAGSASDEAAQTKVFLLGHGFVQVLFGVLTACLPVVSFVAARTLTALWLVVYTSFLLLVAARVWFASAHARNALLGWSAANFAFALGVLLLPIPTLEALLYDAVTYVFVLGIVQVVGGRWIELAFAAPESVVSTQS